MLKYRVITGLLLIAGLVAAAYYLPSAGVWVLLLSMASLMQLEFYGMMSRAGIPVFRVLGTVCGCALISATFFILQPGAGADAAAYRTETVVLVLGLIAVFLRQFPQKHNDKPLETIACTLLGILYVPFLFNFFTRLIFSWEESSFGTSLGPTGRVLVFYLIVVVKSTDTGAYFVGRFAGRHKLFPRISPKKIWEGLFGGVAAAVLASWLFCRINDGQLGRMTVDTRHALALGLLLAGAAVLGDMFESLLKRACGLKDSGATLPGLGGFLDVMDSLLFSVPFFYVYVLVFLS